MALAAAEEVAAPLRLTVPLEGTGRMGNLRMGQIPTQSPLGTEVSDREAEVAAVQEPTMEIVAELVGAGVMG